jgi:hypothetical protein
MQNAVSEIRAIVASHMGPDFHMEIIPFKNQSRDPFEKKTKNRFDLRTALYQYLKDSKNFVFEDALDLRNVPQKIGASDRDYYSSLTHTDEVGVYVFDAHPIGVDLENRERVKPEVVERVCKPKELSLHQNIQMLWSIKEASFKAIPFIVQPKVVTDITVNLITPFTAAKIPGMDIFTFAGFVTRSGFSKVEGFCFSTPKEQLAVAKALVK